MGYLGRSILALVMGYLIVSCVVLLNAQVTTPDVRENTLLNGLDQQLERTRSAVESVNIKILMLNLRHYEARVLEEQHGTVLKYIAYAKEDLNVLRRRPTLSTRFLLVDTLYLLDDAVSSFEQLLTKVPEVDRNDVHRRAFADLLTAGSELGEKHRQFGSNTLTVFRAADSALQSCPTNKPTQGRGLPGTNLNF